MITPGTLAACGLLYSLIATGDNMPAAARLGAEERVARIVALAERAGTLDVVNSKVKELAERLVAHPAEMDAFIASAAPVCDTVR